jgi:Ca-activated chloride channel homolog
MRKALLLLLAMPAIVTAQITQVSQKALNNYIDYANQSAEEVERVVISLADYYPRLHLKNNWGSPRFVCPVQPETYYYDLSVKEGSASTPSMNALKALYTAAGKLDAKCKELDTYHKLEDYKNDNYAKALVLIAEYQNLLPEYNQKQNALRATVEQQYLKSNPTGPYARADAMMRKQLNRERTFLDLWKLNLKEEIPTPWITDQLEKDILATDAAIKEMQAHTPAIGYPASSMWPSFIEGMQSILETKRNALDDYNHEARKSDKHSNDVYKSLINYYNGVLMADYNAFIGFAQGNKYFGVKYPRYVTMFEIRDTPANQASEIQPFKDISVARVNPVALKTPIPKPVFSSLGNYVDFINETYRTVSHFRDVMRNFNSSASSYKGLTSFSGRGGLSFTHNDFVVPLSYYQKCIAESKSLGQYAAPLNQQAEVIMNVLKEMDQIGAAIERETQAKSYEKDQLNQLYKWIERFSVLYEAWDTKKEQLYNDVRAVYDAYPAADATSSWVVSGKALHNLTVLDHEALFSARSFYKSGSPKAVATENIDASLRDVIANEFNNMKGIEKYGRYNGLCPYSPYEDLPATSRNFSEEIKALKQPKKNDNGYSHPYHTMVYMYNDIVDDHNKFAELAKVPLLKTVKQPELFTVVYPEPKQEPAPDVATTTTVTKPVSEQSRVETRPKAQKEARVKEKKETMDAPATPLPQNAIVHDTVYIEKRDTVYIAGQGENFRSMEGYATNNMILLLDVSGSMNAPEKLPVLKQSVLDMLSMMRKEDEIAIIVFSGKTKVLLNPSSFKDGEKIRKAIEELKPGGKTDGNAGLKMAYKVADGNYMRGGNNRIILATDGEFPVSDETTALIEKFAGQDIFLSVFNFGKGMGSSRNLERLSTLGKGNYAYISKENVEMRLIREAKAKKKS